MRHVYLTLQSVEVVDELFEDRAMELRNPFRVLLDKEWLSKLRIDGAAGFGFDENYRYDPPSGRIPFIPGLGPLVLNAKAQLEHRAVRHAYGKIYSTDTLPESTGGVRVAREQEDFLSLDPPDDGVGSVRA